MLDLVLRLKYERPFQDGRDIDAGYLMLESGLWSAATCCRFPFRTLWIHNRHHSNTGTTSIEHPVSSIPYQPQPQQNRYYQLTHYPPSVPAF